MKKSIPLNNDWQIGWGEYQGEKADLKWGMPSQWRDAHVPGDVNEELMPAGSLPDLFYGTNTDLAWWVEHKDWWYRREFPTPSEAAGKRAILVCHGLDTYATVWVNGVEVGRSQNMFIRHEFDVTAALRQDGKANELLIRLASIRHSIPIDPKHSPMFWAAERLFVRKPQMSFGWDIAPRIVTTGLWRPVELVLVDGGRLCNLHARTLRIDTPGSGTVTAQAIADVEWFGTAGTKAKVTGRLHDVKWSWEGTLHPGINPISVNVTVPNAPLWWPIGYGKPNLVALEGKLEADGTTLDQQTIQTGLRRIELVQEPQPSGARSFRFRCNGRDIFITGLNWTPLDPIFARVTDQKITETLEAVAEVGGNMLRVWGGGIYEPAHFYAECSRLGIMIWQDFMMACGWFPQTDAFAAALTAEAEQVVADLRRYPCLALWAGDNENDMCCPKLAPSNRLTRQVLLEVCGRLDPDLPYLPSSPYSPTLGVDPNDAKQGDMHYYAHGTDYHGKHYDLGGRFLSEFGHLSLPSLAVIAKYWPKGSDWPLTSKEWIYHGSNTTGIPFFRGVDCVLKSLAATGRPTPRNIEEAVTASQELQADALVAWIEKYCADPEFGGFMIWNVRDSWPQQSDAVIDCLGNKKIVLGRLKELFERVRKARG